MAYNEFSEILKLIYISIILCRGEYCEHIGAACATYMVVCSFDY